MPPNLWASL